MKGKEFKTTCCIAGDGSAGMIGFLLARSGIAVIALEKHPPVKY